MRAWPEGLDYGGLTACLAEGWDLQVVSVRHVSGGFGSSGHWDVLDAGRRRLFVTVDDLVRKGWLGHDRDVAFAGLRSAFDAALALHRDAGLPFVVAPIPADDQSIVRVGPRHTVAVFPFVDETDVRSAADGPPAERGAMVRMLAHLHQATPVALSRARPHTVALARRHRLESALRELDRPWTGGPFSEAARDLLSAHRADVAGRLETFDRLAVEVAAAGRDPVITHGELHPDNVMHSAGETYLVDWETVALAPPERDLWLVADGADDVALYADATGRSVDPSAMALYRLRWELDDIAAHTSLFRSRHVQTADTETAWRALAGCVDPAER